MLVVFLSQRALLTLSYFQASNYCRLLAALNECSRNLFSNSSRTDWIFKGSSRQTMTPLKESNYEERLGCCRNAHGSPFLADLMPWAFDAESALQEILCCI